MARQHDLTSSDGVQNYLQTNNYPTCVSVERLAEGVSGFVYRAKLSEEQDRQYSREGSERHAITETRQDHLPSSSNMSRAMQRDGRSSKSVKEEWFVAPQHVACLFEMYLTASKTYEAKGLEFLGQPSTNTKIASVRVPRLLSYDNDNHVLIVEDAGDLPSLKSWLQADSPRDQIISVGRSLGTYLAHIHNATANDSALKDIFNSNVVGKNLSSSVYFGGLPAAAEKHGYTQPFIATAAEFAAKEVVTANEVWTLGDFWTGNVLVSAPNEQDEPELTVVDLELAKPGTAAFDIGQMAAEMLCLARFRFEDQGSMLLREFFQAYRAESKSIVDAAAVAIRM